MEELVLIMSQLGSLFAEPRSGFVHLPCGCERKTKRPTPRSAFQRRQRVCTTMAIRKLLGVCLVDQIRLPIEAAFRVYGHCS